MLIFECDIGNTCSKWRLIDATGLVVDSGRVFNSEGFSELRGLDKAQRARVASVASDSVQQQLTTQLRRFGLEPEFALSTAAAAGVSNAYGAHSEKLGVDRWLAVVAAYRRIQAAVLVIDAGTALKADWVDTNGRHQGGYIVPGAEMMKASLFAGTGKVRFETDAAAGLGFGCSTAEAVAAGILASQVGTVNGAINEAKRRSAEEFAILVTGGDAATLVGHIDHPVVQVPDLVLDGLQWLLP